MQSDERVTASDSGGRQDVPTSGDLSTVDPTVLDQIYTLIDAILPFEACLYYQVFPLSIESSCLTVGIVDPDDESAIEYVTKQISYINYSIQFQQITSEWHRNVLSKYLNHSAQQQAGSTNEALDGEESSLDDAAAIDEKSVLSDEPLVEDAVEDVPANSAVSAASDAAAELSVEDVGDRIELPNAAKALPTELPDEPDQPAVLAKASAPFINNRLVEATYILERTEHLNARMAYTDVPTSIEKPTAEAVSAPVADSDTLSGAANSAIEPAVRASETAPTASSTESLSGLAADAPEPELDTLYRDVSELLASMPPQTLMQALLDKVTGEGIGRLYLEPRPQSSRILWSCNGVLEGEIDPISRYILQGVIDEFKRLVRLPVEPITGPQKAEIERDQQGQRILIRLSIMPSEHGEQATIQILRGKALEFYREQYMERLGRDALDVAHKLQQRLGEIRERARLSIHNQPIHSDVLPQLVQLLKQLSTQVQEIEAAYEDGDSSS
ncbi:MAG: hypothetical protein AAF609_11970 [Cyanobacteria bacterium P01_C01_bin.120]